MSKPTLTLTTQVTRADNDLIAKFARELIEWARNNPSDKMAPVQGYPGGIPWAIHMEAYEVYSKRWAPQQAMIEGGCRGGFSTGELDSFIPGWRERVGEFTKMKNRIAQYQVDVSGYSERIKELHERNKELEDIVDRGTSQLLHENRQREVLNQQVLELTAQVNAVMEAQKQPKAGFSQPYPSQFTCIGKGGVYGLLGTAQPAGLSRGGEPLNVYRDIETGALYYRTTKDFNDRMKPLDPGNPAPTPEEYRPIYRHSEDGKTVTWVNHKDAPPYDTKTKD
jgi:hypothetical protein